jgi:hypothetical protein
MSKPLSFNTEALGERYLGLPTAVGKVAYQYQQAAWSCKKKTMRR